MPVKNYISGLSSAQDVAAVRNGDVRQREWQGGSSFFLLHKIVYLLIRTFKSFRFRIRNRP